MNNPFLPPPPKSLSEMSPEEQGEEGARQIMAFVSSCPGKAVYQVVQVFYLVVFLGFSWHQCHMIHQLVLDIQVVKLH